MLKIDAIFFCPNQWNLLIIYFSTRKMVKRGHYLHWSSFYWIFSIVLIWPPCDWFNFSFLCCKLNNKKICNNVSNRTILTSFTINISMLLCTIKLRTQKKDHGNWQVVVCCFSSPFSPFVDRMNDCNCETAKGSQFMTNKSHWLNTHQ